MLEELINFAEELFPSINPYTKEQVNKAIRQFEHLGLEHSFCRPQPFDFLSQGDIIENIPFTRYDKFGNQGIGIFRGILLSNTCDAERDPALLFAPLIPMSEISGDTIAITNNMVYRLMYIPDANLKNEVVDFSLINSFPRVLIEKGLEMGKFHKNSSLNNYGYYLFLIKLTIHLMRPEAREVQSDRNIGIA